MSTDYSRNCPNLYRGIIESNTDPKNLGRCRVRVPSVHGSLNYSIDSLPWARPLVFSPVKKGRGSVNIPDVGDVVWVLFEGANKEYPVYFGGTYANGELDINNDRVDFYIEDDGNISYDRQSKTYTVRVNNNKISVSPDGILLEGSIRFRGELTVGNLIVEGHLIEKGENNL